jgi:hypothetical protein
MGSVGGLTRVLHRSVGGVVIPWGPGNEAPLSPWVGHSCRVLLILARGVADLLARQIGGYGFRRAA